MHTNRISIIAAMDPFRTIGNGDQLPWAPQRIKRDMKHFMQRTMGRPIIMGRKTFESILGYTQGKPLPGRTNIVVTRDADWRYEGVTVVSSLEDAIAKAKELGLSLAEPEKFEALKGKGVKAFVDEKEVMVGGPALLEDMGILIPAELAVQVADAGKKGQTIIFTLKDKQLLGAIALADIIREESREAIQALKEMGVRSAMITGDSEDVARWVSRELGIDEYFARVLPDQKSEKVRELQKRGQKVAMVGDGINDAPALTQADLGIAIGAGTNVAIESAGIILVRNDPRDIVKIIRLSKMTYTKMIQNLFWATGYNIVALPLAAGALFAWGIILEPALAAVFMSASTVIVAINAMLLRRQVL